LSGAKSKFELSSEALFVGILIAIILHLVGNAPFVTNSFADRWLISVQMQARADSHKQDFSTLMNSYIPVRKVVETGLQQEPALGHCKEE
jgi:hypothetical protein